MAALKWHLLGRNSGIVLGLEHRSNDQAQTLSSGWLCICTNLLFEKNDFARAFSP
ncbi:MAG: hypothetical protein ACJAWG_003032 [Candidatus Azotimanducaceae bacterium]|jgi:hypothetical protein